MSLRRALKADFGLDVLLAGGSGERRDPFVIEPCSAAVATRTQLDTLRGLGRGRRELWRLARAEPAQDISPTVQRLTIDAVSFSPAEVITETRSYYFDIASVDGTPDAATPLIEWSDLRTPFSAVSQLGWLHFNGVTDQGEPDRLDVTLAYSGVGATATVYVYESSNRPSRQLPPTEQRAAELQSVCEQIRAHNTGAKSPWPVVIMEPFALQHFLIGEDLSMAGVAVLGKHFLKVRITHFDDSKMRELMRDTVQDLVRLARMAMMQTAPGTTTRT